MTSYTAFFKLVLHTHPVVPGANFGVVSYVKGSKSAIQDPCGKEHRTACSRILMWVSEELGPSQFLDLSAQVASLPLTSRMLNARLSSYHCQRNVLAITSTRPLQGDWRTFISYIDLTMVLWSIDFLCFSFSIIFV